MEALTDTTLRAALNTGANFFHRSKGWPLPDAKQAEAMHQELRLEYADGKCTTSFHHWLTERITALLYRLHCDREDAAEDTNRLLPAKFHPIEDEL